MCQFGFVSKIKYFLQKLDYIKRVNFKLIYRFLKDLIEFRFHLQGVQKIM